MLTRERRMNKEAKALWLTALRSGEYKQFHGALKGVKDTGEVGHCCLGVLTDVAIKTGAVDGEWVYREHTGSHNYQRRWSGDTEGALLPWDVRQWAELSEDGNPLDGYSLNLPSLNDSGMSFEGIANIIEREL
jgi:hypothetical protein